MFCQVNNSVSVLGGSNKQNNEHQVLESPWDEAGSLIKVLLLRN
jgi:hypothetical protein